MGANIQNKLVPFLTVLLVVSAFLIGSLYTKVNMLEKGTVAGAKNQAPTGSGQPTADSGADAPEPNTPRTFEIKNPDVRGNKNAKVTLVQFTDFQCPFCRKLEDEAMKTVQKEYIDTGKVKLIVLNYPLTQIHPYAQKAAEASECAREQGKYWDYHDKLFANNEKLTVDDLKQYAVAVGLNTANFNTCLDGGKMAETVKSQQQLGEANGVRGTPSTFVGTLAADNKFTGSEISGAVPFEMFKSAIDAKLE